MKLLCANSNNHPKKLLHHCKRAILAVTLILPLTLTAIPVAQATGNSHELAPNTHVHVNWMFTKAGDYQADFTITIPHKNSQGKETALNIDTTLNFQVGAAGTLTEGHYDFGPHLEEKNQVSAMVKNPSGNWQEPGEIWFGLEDAAYTQFDPAICSSLGLNEGCSGWAIPQTQQSGIPWLGFNTMDSGIANLMSKPATFTLTHLSGPGDLYVWQRGLGRETNLWFAASGDGSGGVDTDETLTPGNTQHADSALPPAGATAPNGAKPSPQKNPAPQTRAAEKPSQTPSNNPVNHAQHPDSTTSTETSKNNPADAPDAANSSKNTPGNPTGCYPIPTNQKFTLPLQTHVHPNWIFTQPGTYQVGIRQNARINGTWQSADTILNFTVGGAGNANEGHFDLGAKVENGRLTASLKDDRAPGGTWVDPRSLTFGLGAGSQAKLPAGLEFLAPAGTPVWMIGSTQTSGVPWLGANTQHPSLVQATNEPVSWEMISFRGPNPQARLAVFTSGNFGKIVGQKWFTAPTSAANVGRTASGKYCRLGVGSQAQNANISRVTGGLAATGIGNLTLPLAVLAGGIILLGLGMFFQAADRKNAPVAD